MNTEKFSVLEAQIMRLFEAFRHVKEENERLRHTIMQLQEVVDLQQKQSAQLESERHELSRLRVTIQTLREEREIVHKKLQDIVVTIEQLEQLAQRGEGSKV
jgi:predicted RNase H-like nuclease (RuvC/YqgF family)